MSNFPRIFLQICSYTERSRVNGSRLLYTPTICVENITNFLPMTWEGRKLHIRVPYDHLTKTEFVRWMQVCRMKILRNPYEERKISRAIVRMKRTSFSQERLKLFLRILRRPYEFRKKAVRKHAIVYEFYERWNSYEVGDSYERIVRTKLCDQGFNFCERAKRVRRNFCILFRKQHIFLFAIICW